MPKSSYRSSDPLAARPIDLVATRIAPTAAPASPKTIVRGLNLHRNTSMRHHRRAADVGRGWLAIVLVAAAGATLVATPVAKAGRLDSQTLSDDSSGGKVRPVMLAAASPSPEGSDGLGFGSGNTFVTPSDAYTDKPPAASAPSAAEADGHGPHGDGWVRAAYVAAGIVLAAGVGAAGWLVVRRRRWRRAVAAAALRSRATQSTRTSAGRTTASGPASVGGGGGGGAVVGGPKSGGGRVGPPVNPPGTRPA